MSAKIMETASRAGNQYIQAIEITPEMIAAGLAEYFSLDEHDDCERFVCAVYRSMRLAADL